MITPPRSLIAGGHGWRFGVGIAVALGVGAVAAVRLGLRGFAGLGDGIAVYLFPVASVVVAVGSAAAAMVGRSLRAGLQACAWGTVSGMLLIIVAWPVEAPRWSQQGAGLLLDGHGGAAGTSHKPFNRPEPGGCHLVDAPPARTLRSTARSDQRGTRQRTGTTPGGGALTTPRAGHLSRG